MLPSHPVHQQLREAASNRLKKGSLKQVAKQLTNNHSNTIANIIDPLQDAEQWDIQLQDICCCRSSRDNQQKRPVKLPSFVSINVEMRHQCFNTLIDITAGFSDVARSVSLLEELKQATPCSEAKYMNTINDRNCTTNKSYRLY